MKKFLFFYTNKKAIYLKILLGIFSIFPFIVNAFEENNHHNNQIIQNFLWIALLLLIARVASLIEKRGQPAVLGEIVVGIIIGNLTLLSIHWFEQIKTNQFILFLSELGVIFLLFQVGLESNINQMAKVGLRLFLVATVGVVVPFLLGTYLVGPWLFPGYKSITYIFLGATLTATSVGITARIFRDLNKLQTKEAQIVLGAAVIDDVMGLIILAVVSGIATTGSLVLNEIGVIFFKALVFLTSAILIGQKLAEFLGNLLSKISTGIGMKFTLAVAFCLVFAYLASKIGLAPIVGAFAAGLLLDPVYFRFFQKPLVVDELINYMEKLDSKQRKELENIIERYTHKHVEDLIEPLSYFLVPLFFVITGMKVNLKSLFDLKIIFLSAGITLAAVVGKYVSGFVAGKVKKSIVGFGMVPRGEVGLIFASMGMSFGVINQDLFSAIVIMIIITTLMTPPILNYLLKKN